MKKVLLTLGLVLGASAANASGLYLSAGYGNQKPDYYASTTTCELDEDGLGECYGADFVDLPGWPGGENKKNGYEAFSWDEGLEQRYTYKTKDSKTLALAVGWDIPRNPFRFELEYQKTDFKSPNFVMSIFDPDGGYFKRDEDGEPVADSVKDVTRYDFDLSFYKPTEVSAKSTMANVYFEIPGFGAVDPYIGYGIGKTKVSMTSYDEDGAFGGGSDGSVSSKQLIAGVEYRIEDTPWIVGAEYRDFRVNFDEKDDKDPYKLEHKYVMLKVRYDFISDEY